MKTICITGILQNDLDTLFGLLQRAGVTPAKLPQREDLLDISVWHEQVITSAADEAGALHPIEHPGRLWEQLAGEIFLPNLKSRLWGWADTRSLLLLDFWAAFEPRIHFLLVTSSPERMLAAAIDAGNAIDDAGQLLADWQAGHQEMLRFYHRHEARCLLVDAADGLSNPTALLRRCNEHWKLHLDLPTDVTHTSMHEHALSCHLARELCRAYPGTLGLESELRATLVPLSAPTARLVATTESLIEEYRQLKDRSAEVEKLKALQAKLAEDKQQIEQLTKENIQLKKANDEAAKRVSADELVTVQTRLKDAEQENELLLLQLHQVQEELEHYFLQHQEAKQQLAAADARWQRMLQRSPDYIDYRSISASTIEGGIRWRIEHLDAAGRSVPVVAFDTQVVEQCAGYRFAPEQHPLLRWPAQLAAGQSLELFATGSPESMAARLESFIDLSTSDWDLLRALNRLLKQTITAPAELANAAALPLEQLGESIVVLDEVLDQFPPMLRYDSVSLKSEQVNPDYEHLWLRLGNLSYAGLRWPEFEFRLSCASVSPKKFGTHPKLEFPAVTGLAPFETWFEESYDDFGAKLELRFALPNGMDLGVWQQVSNRDRRFLHLLAYRLPSMLATLEHAGTHIKRQWKDWLKLAEAIRQILATQGGQ